MPEAVAALLVRLEPAVAVVSAPLQALIIYMLWRIERRVYGLELLWNLRNVKSAGGFEEKKGGVDRS